MRVPGGLAGDSGVRFPYSGPCGWEEAWQLCSKRLKFPLSH